MKYFDQDFLDFFKELNNNNDKKWFDKNRKRYEKSIKTPFKEFVDVMIIRIKEDDPDVNIEAKDAIFRINRDIRFSKDKRPYNTHVSANISPHGRKSHSHPGFYFQFSFDKTMIGGGAYQLEKEGLYNIRSKIASSEKKFFKLIEDNDFKKKYKEIQGDRIKRIPSEFQAAYEKQPLIANKQFYFMTETKPDIVLKPSLPDTLMGYYNAGKSINDFLKDALK
jgi:uncharacterized protein (TIGR02453 family)